VGDYDATGRHAVPRRAVGTLHSPDAGRVATGWRHNLYCEKSDSLLAGGGAGRNSARGSSVPRLQLPTARWAAVAGVGHHILELRAVWVDLPHTVAVVTSVVTESLLAKMSPSRHACRAGRIRVTVPLSTTTAATSVRPSRQRSVRAVSNRSPTARVSAPRIALADRSPNRGATVRPETT
jgi:hypothetical protein